MLQTVTVTVLPESDVSAKSQPQGYVANCKLLYYLSQMCKRCHCLKDMLQTVTVSVVPDSDV